MVKNILSDYRGNVIGLAVMIATTFIIAIAWIVTMPAVGLFWDAIDPMMPDVALSAMGLLNNVCGWTLLVLVIGTLAYGLALAFRRDPVDLPM